MHKTSRQRRKIKVRSKVEGTGERPRLSIFRSNKQIYVQAIDDTKGKTLESHSTGRSKKEKKGTKTESAKFIGKEFGDKLKKKQIANAIFDRGWYRYHGRVKSLAEGIREAGIKI